MLNSKSNGKTYKFLCEASAIATNTIISQNTITNKSSSQHGCLLNKADVSNNDTLTTNKWFCVYNYKCDHAYMNS